MLGVGTCVEGREQLCITRVAGNTTFAHRAHPGALNKVAGVEERKTWQRRRTGVIFVVDELHAVWRVGDEILLVRTDRRAVAARHGRDPRARIALADTFPSGQILALPFQSVASLPAEADVRVDGRHAGGLGAMFGNLELICLDCVRAYHLAAYLSA